MTLSTRPSSPARVSLCGIAVPADNVRALAVMLGTDEVGRKLERAIDNGNTIVGLSVDERQRLADVLEGPPVVLPELRRVLVVQLKMLKDKETQRQHLRRNRAEVQRRQVERSGLPGTDQAAVPAEPSDIE